MRIHPIFILTAPFIVLVSCAQPPGAGTACPRQPGVHASACPNNHSPPPVNARTLFFRNCAHCHGADAHGDDGPDLHDIGWTDEEIANRIRKGKAGQMTAFEGKLTPEEISALVGYVRELN
jgi:mono/diheme cytochrome c family protein